MNIASKFFLLVAGVVLTGCSNRYEFTPNDNPDYVMGTSVRRMIELQALPTQVPESEQGIPVSGMDARLGRKALRHYRQDVPRAPATVDSNVTVNIGK